MFKLNPLMTALGLCLMSLSTYADTSPSVKPSDVLSVVTLDMNNDGSMDRAVLVNNADETSVDLLIYLGEDGAHQMKLALNKPEIAWTGAMWGQLPSLEKTNKDSLLIKSENSAIGRDRWSQKLTVAYRNNEFILAGYTYESYDTLDPKAGKSCDVNLLTGKGEKNGKLISVAKKAPLVKDWQNEGGIPECE
jgi:hypothetical protein